jgi:hypothetical protein
MNMPECFGKFTEECKILLDKMEKVVYNILIKYVRRVIPYA